jgi:hypothetical protein
MKLRLGGSERASRRSVDDQIDLSTERESSGILTGTEGWVKYIIENDEHDSTSTVLHPVPCAHELVYIHWDNPFVWGKSTQPFDSSVTTTDVPPPCDVDKFGGVLDTGFSSVFTGSGTSQNCRHELFPGQIKVQSFSAGLGDLIFGLAVPVILLNNILGTGDADIKYEITLGLRQQGSVDQTIFSFHDGSLGLRPLATAGQSSVRTLLHM